MYNRYVPQSDGSFRRSRHPEPQSRPAAEPRIPVPPPEIPCPEPPTPEPPRQEHRQVPCHQPRKRPVPVHTEQSSLSFLRQLLPKDFDATDLLVVVLLLLMSGDCPEDQNTALLTLALYLFL